MNISTEHQEMDKHYTTQRTEYTSIIDEYFDIYYAKHFENHAVIMCLMTLFSPTKL